MTVDQREEMEFGVDGGSSCPTYFSFTAIHLLIGFIFDCSSGDCMEEQSGNVFPVVNQAYMYPAVNIVIRKCEDTC